MLATTLFVAVAMAQTPGTPADCAPATVKGAIVERLLVLFERADVERREGNARGLPRAHFPAAARSRSAVAAGEVSGISRISGDALTVRSLRRPALFRRGPHLCARRRRHAPFLAPHRQVHRVGVRHLHPLRPGLRAPLPLAPILARELVDQIGRLAANEMKRFEHRVPLPQPSPGMRFGGAEQPADFAGDFLETGCPSLRHADLQGQILPGRGLPGENGQPAP